ncbi:GH25 family lysozyme [Actinomadura sp. DC4]|uniref:GH25 family lysozyme n=1 Tax=Actinomadura sp. DC4 TaxID=3055069 RepID=UPI0025B13A90|nr:GH25 family lysozyme [Actinomadura sp. DC4]MDN3355154.1 GH25 family lysozyme [Actinomadura sp. DC4]
MRSSRRTRRFVITLAAATSLACGALTAGAASAATPTPGGGLTHPDQDHAGSAAARRTEPARPASAPAGIQGLDVSGWQGDVDWDSVKADGAKFAYVKATESTTYHSSFFPQQFNGAHDVGIVRGAYHYAVPNKASGAAQADYFVDNGGGQTGDGQTLPGVLDIEDDPYTATDGTDECYGLAPAQMVNWISDFLSEYHARTGWNAVINTFTQWWNDCTGGSTEFAAHHPLWINNHGDTPGPMPAGWRTYAIWQWSDTGVFPGDQDVLNDDLYTKLLAHER